jgi:hypothetical protein
MEKKKNNAPIEGEKPFSFFLSQEEGKLRAIERFREGGEKHWAEQRI